MADKPHLRISDQDREQAASEIREHYAAGRLDSVEFEERVQAAYSARTQRELNAISADLPALPPKPPTTTELVRQTLSASSLMGNAGAAGTLFLVCTGIWAITGAGAVSGPSGCWCSCSSRSRAASGATCGGPTAAVAAAGAEPPVLIPLRVPVRRRQARAQGLTDAYCLTKRTRDGSNANVIRCSSG